MLRHIFRWTLGTIPLAMMFFVYLFFAVGSWMFGIDENEFGAKGDLRDLWYQYLHGRTRVE